MRPKLLTPIALVVLVAATPTSPYPISPLTLWELVEQADLIVLADVVAVHELESSGDDDVFSDAEVRLRIREVWHGRRVRDLRVAYGPHVICPAPPRYVEGKAVLAFLYWTRGTWRTVGLSYGTIYPAEGELADFRDIVGRAVAIQSSRSHSKAKIDWMVEAASRPGTRWHGLYGLLPQSDGLHSYYDGSGRRAEADILRIEHLARIARGFVQSPPVDRTLPMALELLASYPDRHVDEAAAAAIEALIARDAVPWWIPEALDAVFRRYGDTDPGARLAPLGDDFEERDIEQVRTLWAQAKTDLGIPTVVPAKVNEPEVWGVGSNTPS